MNSWHLVMFGAAVVGLASGQGSLEWAIAVSPPFDGGDVMLAFAASTVGMALVMSLQLLQKDDGYGARAFRFLMPIAMFTAASGAAALVVAIYLGTQGPAAWLFLAYGVGAMLGLWTSLRILLAISASKRFDAVVRSFLRMSLALVLGYLTSSFCASIVLAVALWGTPGTALGGFLVAAFPTFPLFLFGNSKDDTWWWFPTWVIALTFFSIVIWAWLTPERKAAKCLTVPLHPSNDA
jgi:hypothetical protein